jgi:hypothetical protein
MPKFRAHKVDYCYITCVIIKCQTFLFKRYPTHVRHLPYLATRIDTNAQNVSTKRNYIFYSIRNSSLILLVCKIFVYEKKKRYI